MTDPAGPIAVRPVSNCYLCGSPGEYLHRGMTDRMYSAPGVWNTRTCSRCGLVWLDPQPLPEMMPSLYEAYYTHHAAPLEREQRLAPRLRRKARQGVLAAVFGYHERAAAAGRLLGRLMSLIPGARDTVGASICWLPAARRGRLLDVGCGGGEFLAEMRSLGWDVAGIEPDPVAVEYARAQRGLTVETGTPETSSLPDVSFDVITLNHVIEHVPNPIATLQSCARLLRQGGLIVIVTPNVASLGRHMFGRAWMHWDPPRHFFLFSRTTLETCVGRAGLVPIRTRTPAQGVRPSWGTSRLIQRHGHLPRDAYQNRPVSVRIEEWTALLVESVMVAAGRPTGEEVVLFAGQAGSGHRAMVAGTIPADQT